MELLDGVPLSAYTANGGRVPMQQAITILQGILAGLAAAHAKGIVHRDLKPENVFLAREPSGQFQIKLLDFGIAKVMDTAGGMGTRTRTGALLGTPAYMSPEQVKNPRDVDPRSDLWSAGVMTWEMLTGRVAFPAPTEYARLAAVTSMNPDTLEKVDPAFAAISPVIERAMRKDKAERFASALEMARALPVTASPASSDGSRPYATPLSRLPAVPSIFGPGSAGISPGASSERHTPAVAVAQTLDPNGNAKGSGGTLQSASAVQINAPAPLPRRGSSSWSLASTRCPRRISPCSRRTGAGSPALRDRVGGRHPRRPGDGGGARSGVCGRAIDVEKRRAVIAWGSIAESHAMTDLDPTLDARYLEIFPSFLRTLGDDAAALGAVVSSDAPEPVRRYVVAGSTTSSSRST